MKLLRFAAALSVAALVACGSPMTAGPLPQSAAADSTQTARSVDASPDALAAATYCKSKGGVVQTLIPWSTTKQGTSFQLAGSAGFCRFTAKDKSFIYVRLTTIYSTKPTLAALAYYAKTPLNKTCSEYLANPAVCYCNQQLGGSDFYLRGGSWVVSGQKPNPNNTFPVCVFSDLSIIDSWGLAYHSHGIIRGANLANIFRYKP